jgi:hypothetical protein
MCRSSGLTYLSTTLESTAAVLAHLSKKKENILDHFNVLVIMNGKLDTIDIEAVGI